MARGELAKRVTEKAAANRSEVYKWLRSNYADISKAVVVRGGWEALKEEAIKAGVKVNKKGQKDDPSVPALRSGWLRVKADMGDPKPYSKPRRTRSVQPVGTDQTRLHAPAKPVPGAPAPEPNPDDDTDYQPLPKHTWTPTKLK